METLSLDLVPPGSILASPVTDARGNVLLGAGKALTQEWIDRLKNRGVTKVTVNATGMSTDEALKKLDAMFARAPQDELMKALAGAARQVLSERKA